MAKQCSTLFHLEAILPHQLNGDPLEGVHIGDPVTVRPAYGISHELGRELQPSGYALP